ncbi:hypothetical protein EDEG_01593 [Edhazardia aedis USNM 41457]|uniref:Transmembrane protein n=1 Tax=Edhazardia aedis (strain USNM 41457) TaxID=1003232 RepID=J8ZWS8_EDHAE|nr:hypothetical protein EDEG_01593 [Edhazardia aedis USNM 41457]|eukprot:EJW04113.1 hypothetical protein EDEG_01593 [Edhazardia aedis USNM 41457]
MSYLYIFIFSKEQKIKNKKFTYTTNLRKQKFPMDRFMMKVRRPKIRSDSNIARFLFFEVFCNFSIQNVCFVCIYIYLGIAQYFKKYYIVQFLVCLISWIEVKILSKLFCFRRKCFHL